MKAGRVGLIVAAGLMFGWLVYLGYLALWLPKPVVISRSQLLQASHLVKGEVSIDAAGKPVATIQVRESFGANRIVEGAIEVENMNDVRLPDAKPLTPGTYFFALIPVGHNKYRVVSPSGPESQSHLMIYPWAEVEKQVRELVP
jgi:hypothetical protein